jgi:hypothetical protein
MPQSLSVLVAVVSASFGRLLLSIGISSVLHLSVGRSVKMLLAFASTVVPGFSLLEMMTKIFYTPLYVSVF